MGEMHGLEWSLVHGMSGWILIRKRRSRPVFTAFRLLRLGHICGGEKLAGNMQPDLLPPKARPRGGFAGGRAKAP